MKIRTKYRSSLNEEASINLTALIDVVFVILIIFIVIAPIMELEKIELAESRVRSSGSELERDFVLIYVHSDETVWCKDRLIPIDQLLNFLQEIHRQGGKKVRLFQDKRATFGIYHKVKNIIESAGFERIDLVLKPG